MDEADKNELIAWSKRGNILTRLTSFVGISQKQNQVSFMTSSSVHGSIVKADHFEQSISEARIKKRSVKWADRSRTFPVSICENRLQIFILDARRTRLA